MQSIHQRSAIVNVYMWKYCTQWHNVLVLFTRGVCHSVNKVNTLYKPKSAKTDGGVMIQQISRNHVIFRCHRLSNKKIPWHTHDTCIPIYAEDWKHTLGPSRKQDNPRIKTIYLAYGVTKTYMLVLYYFRIETIGGTSLALTMGSLNFVVPLHTYWGLKCHK